MAPSDSGRSRARSRSRVSFARSVHTQAAPPTIIVSEAGRSHKSSHAPSEVPSHRSSRSKSAHSEASTVKGDRRGRHDDGTQRSEHSARAISVSGQSDRQSRTASHTGSHHRSHSSSHASNVSSASRLTADNLKSLAAAQIASTLHPTAPSQARSQHSAHSRDRVSRAGTARDDEVASRHTKSVHGDAHSRAGSHHDTVRSHVSIAKTVKSSHVRDESPDDGSIAGEVYPESSISQRSARSHAPSHAPSHRSHHIDTAPSHAPSKAASHHSSHSHHTVRIVRVDHEQPHESHSVVQIAPSVAPTQHTSHSHHSKALSHHDNGDEDTHSVAKSVKSTRSRAHSAAGSHHTTHSHHSSHSRHVSPELLPVNHDTKSIAHSHAPSVALSHRSSHSHRSSRSVGGSPDGHTLSIPIPPPAPSVVGSHHSSHSHLSKASTIKASKAENSSPDRKSHVSSHTVKANPSGHSHAGALDSSSDSDSEHGGSVALLKQRKKYRRSVSHGRAQELVPLERRPECCGHGFKPCREHSRLERELGIIEVTTDDDYKAPRVREIERCIAPYEVGWKGSGVVKVSDRGGRKVFRVL